MSVAGVSAEQRYTRDRRCPICGGAESDPRGQERRCIGFVSADGEYARCSREEHAGDMDAEQTTGTYVHLLHGPCHCGQQHGESKKKTGGKKTGGNVVAAYVYTDENGSPLFRVCRTANKKFFQEHPVGGGWVGGRNGARLVPYRLPELLAAPVTETVFIVEGEKDVESLVRFGLVATTNPGGALKWKKEYGGHFAGRDVVIIPDVGEDDPGERHAADVARKLAPYAKRSRIVRLPAHDASDWIAEGGTKEKLLELVESASGEASPEQPEVSYSIEIDPTNVKNAVDMAAEAVSKAPEVYVRGAALTEVVKDRPPVRYGIARDFEMARPQPVAPARLFELIADRTYLFKEVVDRNGETVLDEDGLPKMKPTYPPAWLVSGVMSRGVWPQARPLTSVVETPTLRPDGSLLAAPGYDKDTGVFLQPTVEVNVPAAPTLAQAQASAARLMDLLCNFPMDGAAKSVVVAATCSIIARPAFGNVPLFIFDASTPGSGKGLLADVVNMIALGHGATVVPCSQDDEEQRKVIMSIALGADAVVCFDNIKGRIGGSALDAVLTCGGSWTDRILGKTEKVTLPMSTVFMCTGNNLAVAGDLARRALVARLVPEDEHPERRSKFKHPDLRAYVQSNRGALVSDVLTLLRGYVCAKKPDMKLEAMGSFEAWSGLVRSALVWVGLADPVAAYAADDSEVDALTEMVDAWPAYDDKPFTATQLVAAAGGSTGWKEALVGVAKPKRGDVPTSQEVGYALKQAKDRIFGGYKIVLADKIGHKTRWRRVKVEKGGPPVTPPVEPGPVDDQTWHARRDLTTYDTVCGSLGKLAGVGLDDEGRTNCESCLAIRGRGFGWDL